jgi:ADP-ribose pyrophosphatase YjhB (NUDIX family)
MTGRHLLSFPIGSQRFNYRVAAVIIVDGHVLVCREDDDDYCMLPGGRVELGEDSRLALMREIAEELDLPAEIGTLLATSESFYHREEQDFHELGFFYAVALPGHAPNGTVPWLRRRDEGHDLQFSWLPISGKALEDKNILPRFVPEMLRNATAALTHYVHDERRP